MGAVLGRAGSCSRTIHSQPGCSEPPWSQAPPAVRSLRQRRRAASPGPEVQRRRRRRRAVSAGVGRAAAGPGAPGPLFATAPRGTSGLPLRGGPNGSHGARGAATRTVPLAVPVSRPGPRPCATPRGHLPGAPEPFHGWTGVCSRTHCRQRKAFCWSTPHCNSEGVLGKAGGLDFELRLVMLSPPA